MSATTVPDAIRECLTGPARGPYRMTAAEFHEDMDEQQSLSTVRRHLKAMVACGELEAVEEQGDTGRCVTRYYLPGTVPERIAQIALERRRAKEQGGVWAW